MCFNNLFGDLFGDDNFMWILIIIIVWLACCGKDCKEEKDDCKC